MFPTAIKNICVRIADQPHTTQHDTLLYIQTPLQSMEEPRPRRTPRHAQLPTPPESTAHLRHCKANRTQPRFDRQQMQPPFHPQQPYPQIQPQFHLPHPPFHPHYWPLPHLLPSVSGSRPCDQPPQPSTEDQRTEEQPFQLTEEQLQKIWASDKNENAFGDISVILAADVKPPARQSSGAAGLDIFMPKSFVIQPGQQMVVSTGLQVSPPKSHYIDIRSRSSAQARGLICSGIHPFHFFSLTVVAAENKYKNGNQHSYLSP